MLKYSEKKRHRYTPSQIIVVGFAAVILLGAILLNLPIASKSGESIGFINALFTSTSAVCVTGLVVVDTGTYWSTFGKVIILMLIQVGGLGFMSMATLFSMLIGKRISLRERLIIQESLNQYDLEGLVRLTRHVLVGTFIIEGVGALFLATVFVPEMGLFKGLGYGIFHSVSAFCNAGFDIIGNGRSLTPYVDNVTINIVIMSIIILGGIGFTVILDVMRKKKFSRLTLHSKIVITTSAILISIGFVLFFIFEYNNPDTLGELSLSGKMLAALFQAVTPRTAGFNTIDLSKMQDSSKFLTMILMFIGGSPASTAGGIKTATIAVLVFAVLALIKGREDVEAFKRRISYTAVNKALAVLAIGLSLVIFVTMGLSLTHQFDFMDIFFEAISAFGTVGLSLGITSDLSNIGKVFIIFSMFAGRVGALTILLALAVRQKKSVIRYPEDKILVG
ncbi:TrkH family potassium uptake protein [Alkalithermobacter paradoxus]|uniref:Ktr system potassium uptake protein B n=1 Tax=Alkalithermobacter paradoxus TaxID=29349 RepID=A0A1V4I5D9_9FIRM|nr:Ktr system potassium uptake protein B [[Clostridium] thermoalcaliphilum]